MQTDQMAKEFLVDRGFVSNSEEFVPSLTATITESVHPKVHSVQQITHFTGHPIESKILKTSLVEPKIDCLAPTSVNTKDIATFVNKLDTCEGLKNNSAKYVSPDPYNLKKNSFN